MPTNSFKRLVERLYKSVKCAFKIAEIHGSVIFTLPEM